MDKVLGMLGLAKKAGRLEVGEEPVGGAARAREARLILVAQDAADNTIRRVRHFADAGQCLWVKVPATKDELGRAVGRTSCAMVAVTDIGFAEAAAKKLAAVDEAFAETAERLAVKAQRAAERRKEAEAHERNVRMGKKKPKKEEKAAEEKVAVKSAKPSEKRGESRKEREQRRREGAKRAAAKRFEGARPVKKGKGTQKKDKP
ncbi:MAG: ribosomal L7Ae/L30e/S12e/Gadd45 family protein [Oscillospiraceae bacterium]|nr:ribosomal L7Ae/L30e/S12e/Gadd45 family protein [Oscillospiraceae bacterium]MBQ5739321.1 ribosomal L7Ae/L30e/S12e/Gadd45 family protein [Oscillospiraceae bacterium]